MTAYLWVKLVHILSATVLFGTGIGTAYFMLRAYLADSEASMLDTSKHVVTADWLFTTPAVVVQLVTGLWLMREIGIPFDSTWFRLVLGLYVLTGACWIPVVWIQVRIRDLVAGGAGRDDYRSLMHAWIGLGIPAFSSVLVIFYLMVSRYGAYA